MGSPLSFTRGCIRLPVARARAFALQDLRQWMVFDVTQGRCRRKTGSSYEFLKEFVPLMRSRAALSASMDGLQAAL